MSAVQNPRLSGVVVHWGDAAPLRALLNAWPADDPRVELVVVLNQDVDLDEAAPRVRVVRPERNLGFAGGVNAGVDAASAPAILLLNSDARPAAGALEALLEALDAHPADSVAGLVPALVSEDGSSQHRWQLQPLPTPWTLLAQVFFLAGRRGPASPPPAGSVIEQPAAAALVLRRDAFDAVGGFDSGFFPAWFEDVDFCRRLRDALPGRTLRTVPAARFVHDMGSSVPSLGYGAFLWIYLRHLVRYLRIHHGTGWALVARAAVPVAMVLRLLALPLRRPGRARSRADAVGALLRVALGALTGWRLPADWARRFSPDD